MLLAIHGNIPHLFINSGDIFYHSHFKALDSLSSYISDILPYDLSGSGNIEISFLRRGAGYTLSLDRPGTSLLKSVDDGKGNTWEITYERAPPVPSLYQRSPLLAHLRQTHSGSKPVHSTFAYADPATSGTKVTGSGKITR